ncbi:MAG: 2-amino-4-hydroxy-6-hydroxymethyldihydropteridine diphosphokinase [Elusimicrobiota bacterium]|nr:MAG: 2-amino-4-hydroxy-6-hydroxymethyldihydropteridine diphosphokinase [Elusimicrobiota bacterium]
MRPALFLLGANLGRRDAALAKAVSALRRLEGVRVLKTSRLYETAPVGPSSKPYLNLAVRAVTSRTAMGLLIEAKRLEAAAGRRPGARWTARVLDVDVVSLGRERTRTPWLTVPHPLMARRPFAAAPLADVAPSWRPILAAMNPPPGIVRLWRHGR